MSPPHLRPVDFGGDVARLHGQHRKAVLAVQRLGGDRQRGDVALVPIDDEQRFRAVLGGRRAGLDHHPHVGFRRERDRRLERHVHGRDAERRRRQNEPVHALGDRVGDDGGGERVGAGRQVRAVLLDAAGGQDDERILRQLRGDLRLGQLGEIAARQHGGRARCPAPRR